MKNGRQKTIKHNGKTILTFTRYQQNLKARDKRIVNLFDELREENPDASTYSLCRAIFEIDDCYSVSTIRNIIRKYGRD